MAKVTIEIDTGSDHEHGSSGKPHPMLPAAAANKKIGILSSISLDTVISDTNLTLYDAYKNGLNDRNADHQKGDKKGYKGDLKTTIDGFNSDRDLIVTFGGSITYKAAAANSAVNFVSLVGRKPDVFPNPPSLFRGGVSLDSFNANRDRLTLLMDGSITGGISFAKDKIGLFCNKNSDMNQAETDNWNKLVGKPQGDTSQIIFAGNNGGGDNDIAAYSNNFTDANNAGLKALVVSADPFFQDTKNDLISAANKWIDAGGALYICYPSLNYRNIFQPAQFQPRQGHCTLYGPKLEDAYFTPTPCR